MAKGPYVNRAPDYADLDLDFYANPTTKDVAILSGENAIKRSVRNLVMTNHFERPFQSHIGSNIRRALFDNVSAISALILKDAIRDVITNFERRVKVLEVNVDGDPDNNGYNVTVKYVILNRQLPIIQSLFLERIR